MLAPRAIMVLQIKNQRGKIIMKTSEKKSHTATKNMIICAVFAALLCIFSVMTIPIGVIPISMGIFGVILTSCILNRRMSVTSVFVYILLGAVGLPVFSGFKGGIAVIAGPTGGYITSYILVALFISTFARTLPQNKLLAILKLCLVSFVGVIICYLFGTLQFMAVAHKDIMSSLAVCVLPFVPFDIIKCVVASTVAYAVKNALIKAKLLSE